jgi:peptidylprolyl isomerase
MLRPLVIITTAVALAATSASAAPRSKATARKPAAPAPAAAPAGPGAADWRTPDAENVLVIDTNKGRIVVEMLPEVAPAHVTRVRELTREKFYDGHTFFRVIENFMAQTGDPENTGVGGSTKPDMTAEFTFRRGPETMTTAADQGVAEVGFVKSLPVMSQSGMLMDMTNDGRVSAWALFCPGVAAMARASDPNSANSQFFLMRAGYPSLEKRYTAWGRVISGQEVVRAIKLGEPVPDPQDRMQQVRVLADMPADQRPQVRVIDPKSAWFKTEIERTRAAKGADFSACDVRIPAEVK